MANVLYSPNYITASKLYTQIFKIHVLNFIYILVHEITYGPCALQPSKEINTVAMISSNGIRMLPDPNGPFRKKYLLLESRP